MERKSGFSEAMGIIGSMLFGALIGAVVALLMAPKSGSELRKDLADGANRMGERLSETTHDVAETVKTKVNELTVKAEAPERDPQAD